MLDLSSSGSQLVESQGPLSAPQNYPNFGDLFGQSDVFEKKKTVETEPKTVQKV